MSDFVKFVVGSLWDVFWFCFTGLLSITWDCFAWLPWYFEVAIVLGVVCFFSGFVVWPVAAVTKKASGL